MNLDRRKFAEWRPVGNNWLEAIVDRSDDAIVFKDPNGVINTWNKGAERIFGYSAEEAIGKPGAILIPPEHENEERDIITRIRRGERVERYETVRRRKNGDLVNVSLMVSPVMGDDGKITGALKIARDITDRVQAEQNLAEALGREETARREIEGMARTRDDFIAMLSHELRTPLNPVLLIASDSANNPELPADIRAQFETILKNVEVQARLIDDLLDASHVNHGKLKLKMKIVDAHAVLREAIETVQSQIKAKQIRFASILNAEKHLILADAVRLQQIFWNILTNAAKFTPSDGTITVETFSRIEDGRFSVKISDTGIGMMPEELDRVFSAFSQGSRVRHESSNYGGLGLGLAISKRLVELHGGGIRATSDGNDRGSAFVVEFPLA